MYNVVYNYVMYRMGEYSWLLGLAVNVVYRDVMYRLGEYSWVLGLDLNLTVLLV